jgi:hypothetical protein
VAAATPTLSAKGWWNTSRYDAWWVSPLLQFIGFSAAIIYSTWAAFQGTYYYREPYLSPFYSPTIIIDLKFWPFTNGPLSFLSPLIHPISPALVILIFPLGFRLTCYYYRKMYYRTYFMEPTACAVGEPGEASYSGETRFPFNLLNLHRYLLYAALVILVLLSYDFVLSFNQGGRLGIGVGTAVLGVNLATLSLYTFSCHSLRHLVGGRLDCFSCSRAAQVRYRGWRAISKLNKHHMLFAWVSLGAVCFADFYVRLLAGGITGSPVQEPVVLVDPLYFAVALGVLIAALAGFALWAKRQPKGAASAE